MTVGGEETAAMFPEPRPDFFTVGLWQVESIQRRARKELKPALGVNGW